MATTDEAKEKLRYVVVGLSEYIGTTLLVFLSCTGCSFGIQTDASMMHVSFTAGLAVMAVIQIFGHVSGALVNPSVSVSAYIMDQITAAQLPVYVIAQVAGSLTGSALHLSVTPSEARSDSVCVTLPNLNLSVMQALAIETLLSIVLNFAICSAWDKKNSTRLDSVALRIGLVVVVANLSAAAYTGASMNPSRSLGPAVWSGNLTNHWIYWVGPTLGAVIASYFYKLAFRRVRTTNELSNEG